MAQMPPMGAPPGMPPPDPGGSAGAPPGPPQGAGGPSAGMGLLKLIAALKKKHPKSDKKGARKRKKGKRI